MLLTVLFRIQLVAQNEKRPPRYVIKALSTLGGTVGVGEAINNKGWITGAANLPGDTTQHATLWRRGVLTDLGTLGGPSSRVVGGVKNTDGEVAGGSETSIPDPLGETLQYICRRLFWSVINLPWVRVAKWRDDSSPDAR